MYNIIAIITAFIIFEAPIFDTETLIKINAKNAEVYSVSSVEVSFTETNENAVLNESIAEEKYILSNKDIELIALVTMAEAEGECEKGKRLVIDTILNRMDSEYFPNTAYDVIYQKNQFSSMWNGRVDKCEIREDICKLVREEINTRTDYNVVFFTAGGYGAYGVPMFQVGNHYFSRYE